MITYLTSRGLSDAQIQLISGHESKKSLEIYQHLAVGAVEQAFRRLSTGSASNGHPTIQNHWPVRLLVPLLEFNLLPDLSSASPTLSRNGSERRVCLSRKQTPSRQPIRFNSHPLSLWRFLQVLGSIQCLVGYKSRRRIARSGRLSSTDMVSKALPSVSLAFSAA
jgi:hypothetical protein